jgi:hypothetical protein
MVSTGKPIVWREHWSAVAILGAVIMLVYGDIVFMGYTLSPALSLWSASVLTPPFGYAGRSILFPTVIDPLATGGQNWPVYVLIGKILRTGQLPLWNPYQGTGAPLAADESWSTYFPFDLLYVFIGNPYWDIVWLLKLWVAGILAYLLLRHMELSFSSAIGGGLAYCLSGAFIWSPFMNWTNVAVLMPALLLVVMKCFERPLAASSIVSGSLAFGIALLGTHAESILIQFSYVLLFVIFEAATRRDQRIRGLATWAITILLGLGLAAFYLLPFQEYVGLAFLFHGPGVGYWASLDIPQGFYTPVLLAALISWVSLFVPYLYGFLHTYFYPTLRSVFFWDWTPGYMGTCVLFLSLIPLWPIVKRSLILPSSKYYAFFVGAAILILMKLFEIPPISWIGFLPALTYVNFPRYSGSVLAISFAGAGAYGIEFVARGKARNDSRVALLLVLVAILPATFLTIPNPLAPSERYFPVSVAYLTLSVYYAAISAYVATKGGDDAARTLVCLLLLELVSYIPRGITIPYEAFRVSVLAGAGFLLAVRTAIKNSVQSIDPIQHLPHIKACDPRALASPAKEGKRRASGKSVNNFLARRHFIAITIIAALILQFAISGAAPNGIPQRYDPYTTPPFINFLRANLGYQRAYSPDPPVLFPPSAGVYGLQDLGEFSALMPASFSAFSKADLDRGALAATLVGNWYTRLNSTISVQGEILANLASYSLLGVKYFVMSHPDMGTGNANLPIVYHDLNATIYQNLRVFPRTFLVGKVEVASNETDAILKTKQLGWQTRNQTVVEGMPQNEISIIDSAAGEPGNASIEQYSANSVSIRVLALRVSVLVLTDTYYPGWNAYLDGSLIATYRTYGLVRGVFIPPGHHQVLFKYEPTSFEIGAIISIFSGALLCFVACSSVYESKHLRSQVHASTKST